MQKYPHRFSNKDYNVWIKDLAPSIELLEEYYPKDKTKQPITSNEFDKRYRQEMMLRQQQDLIHASFQNI
jgi:uncharacterized protein YeaO (DUF488 family)